MIWPTLENSLDTTPKLKEEGHMWRVVERAREFVIHESIKFIKNVSLK
jgi:hypothetical protein